MLWGIEAMILAMMPVKKRLFALPPTFDKSRDVRKILLEVVAHNVLFKNCSAEEQDCIVDSFEKEVVAKDELCDPEG